MVVRKEVCLTQSEWYVMDCLWAYAPQTVMQLATDLSQRAAGPRAPPSPLWSRWRPRDWSAAHPWAGTRSITMCAAGGGSKVGGLLLPGPYLSGECGADGVRHGGWQAGHPAAVARLGKGDRPKKAKKAALAAAAVLLTLAAVLAFGGGPPSPYSYAGYAAAVEALGPSISQRRQSPARGILP